MKPHWRTSMLEAIRQLQEETDRFGQVMTASLTDLRADMKREFAEQKLVNEEQKRINEEQKRINDEQARINEEQRRINEEHGRIIARQGASFDQSMAAMIEQHDRHRSATGLLWGTLMERTAEMAVDFEAVKADTTDLKRRMAAVEKRLAG